MLKLVNKDIEFPKLYPKVVRKLATAKERGEVIVGGFKLRKDIDFIPQIGLQEDVCACEANVIFMCGQGTAGKAQPYDAKVLTPNGFIDMGNLRVGDTIMGADGSPQTVLYIFEQGTKDVYRLTFDDGAQTECCAEHLWEVHRKRAKNTFSAAKIMQFKDIKKDFDSGTKFAIRMCKPIEFEEKELPISPYLLGLMIGDGHMRPKMSIFSSMDEECIEAFRHAGYRVSKRFGDNYDYNISGLGFNQSIRNLGLTGTHSNNKFIPNDYKYNSVENRLYLLQGLIDTDGTVNKFGHLEYYTISERLAKDIQWVVRSLGGRCNITTKIPTYTFKGEKRTGQLCYRLHINTEFNTKLARLQRKRDRLFDKFRHGRAVMRRRLVKYELIGKKECRCILVSSPDHLYITDDFIVTHNTFALYFKALGGVDKYGFTSRIISVRALDSKKGSTIFRDGVTVCGNFADCQYNSSDVPTFMWPQWNSNLQLIHSNFNYANPSEKEEFEDYAKKQQSSLIMIDEATEMKHFGMFAFWFMRNRDNSGMTPQMICTFNPSHEHWTTQMLFDAGYLNGEWKLRKDMIGKLRYFYNKGDNPSEIIWGDTPNEVVERAGLTLKPEDEAAGLTVTSYVKSFTVFTGTAADNRELVNATGGQSVANLHAVGKTQRAIVGEAYFGPVDNEEINVNRQMIHQMWENPINDDENNYATMDISSGKAENDKCPMIIWHGLQMIAIEMFSGKPTELQGWIQMMLDRYNVPVTNFAFDATGHGYWVQAFTAGIPVTWNKRVMQEYDASGNQVQTDEFFNLRSQLLGKTEVLLKSGLISCVVPKDKIIPYGHRSEHRRFIDILFDETNLFITLKKNKKTYYRSTDEFKAKFKFSPDIMTTIAIRAVFELDTRERKQPPAEVADDAYDELYASPPYEYGYSGW